MKLHFLGANRQVTGSRYILEAVGKQVMIDCGMFQERHFQSRNWDVSAITAREIDALVLTHVHIDHCGLVPKLAKEGFLAPLYCTEPSAALLEVMLRDSAEIQMEDAEYKQRRHRKQGRRGPHPEEPLYTDLDVTTVLPMVQPRPYLEPVEVVPGMRVTFHDAGHILGSAMLEFDVTEAGRTTKVIFSGDIGQWDKPIIEDPTYLSRGDYIVMESTYGDRLHRDGGDVAGQLARVVTETHARGGNVVIPTFATERAQELMFYFGRLVHAGEIPQMPVFLDSPMAVDITGIFLKFELYFDAEMRKAIESDVPPLRFPGLKLVRTADESKRINKFPHSCVIMSSSGMCNAGRIKHHLKNNLPRPESTILFVGHQSEGTLGRQILDGAKEVRIHGELFPVRAHVAQIYGFSAHGDRDDLLRWLRHFQLPPKQLFLTHGEERVSLALADTVREQLRWPVSVPNYLDVVELA